MWRTQAYDVAIFQVLKPKQNPHFKLLPLQALPPLHHYTLRCVATIVDPAARFDEMIIGPQPKYYFLDHGHPTIVISTDPAHSLSDTFAQDLAGWNLVTIDGLNSPLLALQITPDKAKEEFQSASQKNGGSAVKDFMNNMGLGMLADQVMQFVESPQHSMFSSVNAVNESSRLHASLRKECVPVHKLIVNQILPPSVSDCKFCTTKRKEQMHAIEMIRNDPELANLRIIEAPLVDLEIRGVPALKFMAFEVEGDDSLNGEDEDGEGGFKVKMLS
ncbi:hypothetical protein F3Y22_tig00003715pilonHSYRG00263 [Hibiscus syriacus]|uniref:ArsA/GET3 Anion-transporting ATPase-like domain-containing protein n=1 Tax=Hibiscus syriacus TaxID=106335 RepID=A0A6A3CK12_HIBSY|nr:hypothetical protein F3Y22_tig00003715pilonHSYRG00263 [Hibiscus syriacus]